MQVKENSCKVKEKEEIKGAATEKRWLAKSLTGFSNCATSVAKCAANVADAAAP